MKQRLDFVSNSSSSSFIIYNEELDNFEIKAFRDHIRLNNINYLKLPNPQIGNCTFGREDALYSTIGDKLNFAALQCFYCRGDKDKFFLIKKLMKEEFGVSRCVLDKKLIDSYSAYIDHQSAGGENGNNKMLENYESLKNFIMNKCSICNRDDDDEFYNDDEPFMYE